MVDAITFFGSTMKLVLPASLDIYLMECKTHSSEIRLAKYLIKNLKKGDSFIDIGAHFGFFSLLASSLVGENGKIFSVEAAEGTFSILDDNVKNKSNLTPFHIAMGSSVDVLKFYEFPILYSEYNSVDKEQYENLEWFKKFKPEEKKVKQITLDLFCSGNNIKPNIIKIDVEGNELPVIEGGRKFLIENNCEVIMEFVLSNRDNIDNQKYVKLLNKLNYETFFINDNGELYSVEHIEKEMKKINSDSENIVFVKKN